MTKHYLLTFSCKDTCSGILAGVTTFLSEQQAFILELSEFGDIFTNNFFLRCLLEFPQGEPDLSLLSEKFQPLAQRFDAEWKFIDLSYKPKIIILVSKFGHCLNDLLHRHQSTRLPVEIIAVISNHRDHEKLVQDYGLSFLYFPTENKDELEKIVLSIVEEKKIDLIILARYMQILSPFLTEKLTGKIINIHHSFLPSFKGAKPYHQAFERGVKIIGASAHYVTQDLDEGPIIEQEVLRVDHSQTPEALVLLGYDIEAIVLARAVKYHVENRVFLNDNKTVVFK